MRFESAGDRLTIETDYDELEDGQKLFGLFRLNSIDRPSTEHTVTVLRTSSLIVDMYSAATTGTDLNGTLRVDTFSGTLSVRALQAGAPAVPTRSARQGTRTKKRDAGPGGGRRARPAPR